MSPQWKTVPALHGVLWDRPSSLSEPEPGNLQNGPCFCSSRLLTASWQRPQLRPGPSLPGGGERGPLPGSSMLSLLPGVRHLGQGGAWHWGRKSVWGVAEAHRCPPHLPRAPRHPHCPLCAFQPWLSFPFPGRGVSAFTPAPCPPRLVAQHKARAPCLLPVAPAAWSVSPALLLGLTRWGKGQGALGGSVPEGPWEPEASETVAQTVGSRPPWLHSQWQSCDSQVALSWERTDQGHPPNLRRFPRPREGATHTAGAHGLERLGRLRPHSTPGMLGELATGRAQVRVGGAGPGCQGHGAFQGNGDVFRLDKSDPEGL